MAIHIPDALAAFTAGPDWIRFDDSKGSAFCLCSDDSPTFVTLTARRDGLFGAHALHYISMRGFGLNPVDLSGLPGLLADVQAIITKATTPGA